MDVWELIAREQIRDTIARYNHAGDAGHFDEMVDQFTLDGVLELRDLDQQFHGRAELREYFASVGARFAARERRSGPLRHFVTNVQINVTPPSEATSVAYFLVITDIGLDHWGRYRDQLVPVDDRWLLGRRSVRTDGFSPGSLFAR